MTVKITTSLMLRLTEYRSKNVPVKKSTYSVREKKFIG